MFQTLINEGDIKKNFPLKFVSVVIDHFRGEKMGEKLE